MAADRKKKAKEPIVMVPALSEKGKITPELFDYICNRISEGETLLSILREPGMPKRRTFYDYKDSTPDNAAQFARAREIGADAIAEDTKQTIECEPERGPDGRIDPGFVAWQKAKAYHNLQLLAKWASNKYGNKIDHTSSDGSMTPKPSLDVSKLSTEALLELKRLHESSEPD